MIRPPDPAMLRFMMKRRDLAWVTDQHGTVIAVGIVVIDETGQRVDHDVTILENEHLHLPPGIQLPAGRV